MVADLDMPAGRPSDYSPERADIICERLASGESLRSICRDENMPGQSSVFRWLREHSEFREQYTRAREVQADTLFDETLDIADDGSNDWMERNGKSDEPGWAQNGEALARSKLRIDTRKWMAGKLAPQKYTDQQQHKVELEHTVPDSMDLARAVLDVLREAGGNGDKP